MGRYSLRQMCKSCSYFFFPVFLSGRNKIKNIYDSNIKTQCLISVDLKKGSSHLQPVKLEYASGIKSARGDGDKVEASISKLSESAISLETF